MGEVLIKKPASREKLRQWAEQKKLFALVDSHFGPWRKGAFTPLNAKDTDPEFYDMIAWGEVTYAPPSLVQIEATDLEYIESHLMTDRWGLFLISESPLEDLVRHFQKFVIARGPDGDPYFFKFQDAAVLEVFLNAWNREELDVFFGPATHFGVTDLDRLDFSFYEFPERRGRMPIPEVCLITLKQKELDECYRRIEADLVKIIGWHLRQEHSGLVQKISGPVLDARVLFGLRKARHYGLETVADLAGFVGLMFEIAPNFDDHPKISALLNSQAIPADQKLDELIESVTEREWEEASMLYDDEVWPDASKRRTGS